MNKCSDETRVKMILFWVLLLHLHQGYTLDLLTTAQLGEAVNLTCVLPDREIDSNEFHWYKQNAGDSLKLILKLRRHAEPVYGPGFSPSRVAATKTERFSTLSILQTVPEDEGTYHCAIIDWVENFWQGTYLSLKGNNERTSEFTVLQWPNVSVPTPPVDSVTLQCSVLSHSEETCSEDLRVFWFRTRSYKTYPDIIFSDGDRSDECEKGLEHEKRCLFSMNINPSDAGTYYCAVATCGQILFGNGTKLEAEQTANTMLALALTCLAISVFVNIVFICYHISRAARQKLKDKESDTFQERHDTLETPGDYTTENVEALNYAPLQFSEQKSTKEKEKTEQSIYAQVKL